MDLELSEEQDQLVHTLSTVFAKACSTESVRACEPLGFDPGLWRQLVEFGLVAMAVAEEDGGGGATLLDLALASEAAGRRIAPVPVVEAVVTARLLARAGAPASALLTDALTSSESLTLALRPAVEGRCRLVPAGAIATVVVGLDGDDLVAVTAPPPGDAPANIASAPISDRSLRDADRVVLASHPNAVALHEHAVAEWKSLTAAQLTGLAAGTLEMAVEYAKVREQFGVPIGSFQALAHRLADAATAIDGCRLLALEAAWSADEAPDDFGRLASMAFAWAAETAADAAAENLHIHGGMGFSVEGDAQLYFRRATGWPKALHGIHREYQVLADLLYGPAGS